MFKRSLTLTLSLLLFTVAFHISADAQIEKAALHLDAFLCGNVCVNDISKALKVFTEEIKEMNIDPKTRTVTITPEAKKSLDLYDIRQELQNAGRIPWKIEITVTGEVVDYTKTYSGGHSHPRKALQVKETGQQFLLIEGEQRDGLLDFVKAGHEKVTISGEIPAFDEKHLPVLLIKVFKAAKAESKADQ